MKDFETMTFSLTQVQKPALPYFRLGGKKIKGKENKKKKTSVTAEHFT